MREMLIADAGPGEKRKQSSQSSRGDDEEGGGVKVKGGVAMGWRGRGETTLKVTELSVPRIAGIPPARPIGLPNFIKQLPSKTYKQAWSREGGISRFRNATTDAQTKTSVLPGEGHVRARRPRPQSVTFVQVFPRCAASPCRREKTVLLLFFVVVVVLLIGSLIRRESVLIGRGCSEIPGRNQKPGCRRTNASGWKFSGQSFIDRWADQQMKTCLFKKKIISLLRDDVMSKTLFSTV